MSHKMPVSLDEWPQAEGAAETPFDDEMTTVSSASGLPPVGTPPSQGTAVARPITPDDEHGSGWMQAVPPSETADCPKS